MGITMKEAGIILAVAEILSIKNKDCTSEEVKNLMQIKSVGEAMKTMGWALNIKEAFNDRGKKAYYYNLNANGLKKVSEMIEFEQINLKEIISKSNNDKKK
jgi:hypothetical protein